MEEMKLHEVYDVIVLGGGLGGVAATVRIGFIYLDVRESVRGKT